MDTAATIAQGGQPYWEETFDHPKLGKLTFKVSSLPRTKDWLAHAVAQEQYGPGLSMAGLPSALAAAVAAMKTFIQVPVIDEKRIEDPDNGHVRIEQTFYDPLEDEHVEFVTLVWASFYNWRAQTLSKETQDAVKNSSGATSGPESAEPSPATTDSPQPTHA